MKSTSFSLNVKDALKGLIVGVGTPVVYLLQQLIPSWGTFLTQHLGKTGGALALAAISAFVTYIIKNFLTDTNAAAVTTLTVAATKAGEPITICPLLPVVNTPYTAPGDSTATKDAQKS